MCRSEEPNERYELNSLQKGETHASVIPGRDRVVVPRVCFIGGEDLLRSPLPFLLLPFLLWFCPRDYIKVRMSTEG
jgi:hypothetical protein